jgi:AcrR family transcriptional regulator
VGSPRSATKTRLLDAAEQLFAAHGFEGTSMRAVTQAAATSVSAANYHFGSKEALLAAAIVRRLQPLNRQRLDALDALEAASDGAPILIDTLLEAFLRPSFEALHETANGPLPYRHLAAQLHVDPHEMVVALKIELFAPVMARYIDALARSLPDRSREDLALNFQFVVGVLVHVISGHVGTHTETERPEPPDERVLQQLVAFAAAGIRAKCDANTPACAAGATP